MVYIWGTKNVYSKMGHVADFCPICRRLRAFSVRRTGLAKHIYYVTISQGDLVCYERTCLKCKTILAADLNDYECIPEKNEPLPALVNMSNPHMMELLKDRLALEDVMRKAPTSLDDELRFALIHSPFYLLSPMVERRLSKLFFDPELWLAIGASVLILKIVPGLADRYLPAQSDRIYIGSLIFCLLLVFWQLLTQGNRYVRKRIVPVLAKSLEPLRPKVSELNVIVRDMKERKHKLGRKIKVADIQRYL